MDNEAHIKAQNERLKALIERCSDPAFHEYVRLHTEQAFEEYDIKIPGVTKYRVVVPERNEFVLVIPPLDNK